jgi:hypothetical protein
MTSISTQLTTLINLITKGNSATQISPNVPSVTSTPPRHKRTKHNLTPDKPPQMEDVLPQDTTFSSASSDIDELSEGCEE